MKNPGVLAIATMLGVIAGCAPTQARRTTLEDGPVSSPSECEGVWRFACTAESRTLDLRGSGSFTYSADSCLRGPTERGTWSASNDRIRLTTAEEVYPHLADELLVVTWGPRRYLVPSDGLATFCNMVNAGEEPGASLLGLSSPAFVRVHGGDLPADGKPALPPPWDAWILDAPVVACVIDSVLSIPDVRTTPHELETRVTLDAGLDKGLVPGMTLFPVDEPGPFSPITLTEVSADRSQGVMTRWRPLALGSAVSTRVTTPREWIDAHPPRDG
ncbi:MAG: hypothetical protein H6825_00540 [Planctomycetes bacterium]|nr:hypothetical protein [Planctomycetota bacterium]